MLGSFARSYFGQFNGTIFNIELFYAIHSYYTRTLHLFNQNMENYPGKPYNHKAYGSALAE
jgi:hypothetical protein